MAPRKMHLPQRDPATLTAVKLLAPATDAKSSGYRNCGATSISVGCDDCCLTHVVARCGPGEADTIGIRPVLPPAWKWQRIRNMCHDREGPQIGNVRRQHENARPAYYADRKGDEQFPTQNHVHLPYPPTRHNTRCNGPSIRALGFATVRSTQRVLRLASNRSTRTGDGHRLSSFDNACTLLEALVGVGAG